MRSHRQIVAVIAVLVVPFVALSDELSEALKLAYAGDERAGPILLALVENGGARIEGFNGHLIPIAFGKLKYRPAAPILAKNLFTLTKNQGFTAEMILNALADIGDISVTNALQQYLASNLPPSDQTAVRRVLIQLEDVDPVPGLLGLLDKETYEPERSEIIRALTQHPDERVVKRLAGIAAESESAFMRREAIFGLEHISDRRSLLALAALLDLKFPKDLKAEWGWKGIPDFRRYFPDTIAMCLRQCTKQDFGTNRAQWEKWINENIELRGAANQSQPVRTETNQPTAAAGSRRSP